MIPQGRLTPHQPALPIPSSMPETPSSNQTPPHTTATRDAADTQADALARLRTALDDANTTLAQARTAHDTALTDATAARDRALTDAARQLESTLERIAQQAAETRAQIAERHEARLAPVKKQRADAIAKAQAELRNATAKAKKQREESQWLADTVYESGAPTARNDFEAVRGRIAPLQTELDTLEQSLIRALGPARAAEVATAPTPPETAADTPTLDALTAALEHAREGVRTVEKGGALKLIRSKSVALGRGTEARDRITAARRLAEDLLNHAGVQRDEAVAALAARRDRENNDAQRAAKLFIANADRAAGAAVRASEAEAAANATVLQERRDRDVAEVQRWESDQTAKIKQSTEQDTAAAKAAHTESTARAEADFAEIQRQTRDSLAESSAASTAALDTVAENAHRAAPPWDADQPDSPWLTRPHPGAVPAALPLGRLTLDLAPRLARLAELDAPAGDAVTAPERIDTPLAIALPGPRSLLIAHDPASRDAGLATLRTLMLRILGAFPAGKVRLTMADPIGLGQSFAGFMRLADQEPSPVGLRIWSEPNQIERQLADLTEHMQTVIQKYLRSDYATIEDYNHAAGEIAEPYRFVVIADLPTALTEAGAGRLASILESGPRCGVYALLASDHAINKAAKLPPTLPDDTLANHALRVEIRQNHSQSIAKVPDPRFDETALTLDTPPPDAFVSAVLDRVAKAGKAAGRVEVPFNRLAPTDDERWTRSAAAELSIPLGRSGAQKIQHLRLGSGTRQHALIAGRTGSGKSTLLHVMISAAALWHSPDELNLYLIDFKKGVEFKAYTNGQVPHVRAVAIESDREFGLSVLQRLDDELTSRGELFRRLGAQDLAAARRMAPDTPLPRVLLLIDEFQEFFVTDDEVASASSLLLDRLVRQGRAFGVHVVLGSQTLSGAYSLARSTLGQMGVRIALQCSEADSYLILGEDNNAARLLARPGEAIYNDAGGLVEGNSPFQTAWLPDTDRDQQLARMPAPTRSVPAPIVFEGNVPAKLDTSASAFVHATTAADRVIPRALLGDPVAIAPPVAAALRKRSGANLIIVGPQPEPALGMLAAAAISAGSTPNARTIVIDPTPEDDTLAGRLNAAVEASGIAAESRPYRAAAAVVAELDALVRDRQDQPKGGASPVILVLAGLHRLRDLRKSDDYSFSLDEDAGQSADKQLAHVLREGPGVGIWTLAWCDTLTNLERALDRSTVREFGLRALMQMGASDSAALIDSSAASNLGVNRALLADDEAGTIVKFRPVDLPTPDAARRAGDILRT